MSLQSIILDDIKLSIAELYQSSVKREQEAAGEIETLTKRVEELESKLSSIYKACPIESNNVLINRIKNIANNKGA